MATLSVPPSAHEKKPLRLTAYSGIFFWGAVGLLLAGILTYAFIVWFGVDNFQDADATRALERQKILQDRVAEDTKYLHDAPSWFKKDAGTVRVPIEEAMALTLPALQANKPHPAYPIAQSPPQNSSAPTSPDKGPEPGAKAPGKTNDTAPAASNPTVGQSSPAPVAPSPTPAPATVASTAPASPSPTASAAPTPATNNASNPGNPPSPGTQAQPAAPAADTNTSGPVASPAPAAPTAAASAAPTAAATAAPSPAPPAQEPGVTPAGTP